MRIASRLTIAALACLPFAGFAETEDQIDYAEAVAKCNEFVNDPQLVQIKFKVSCFDENLAWQELERRTIEQSGQASIGHRILMKQKWATPDFVIPVVTEPVKSDCPVLGEFVTTRQAELTLSCEELVDQYSEPENLITRCEEVLAGATPQTEPTGKQVDLCGGTQGS